MPKAHHNAGDERRPFLFEWLGPLEHADAVRRLVDRGIRMSALEAADAFETELRGEPSPARRSHVVRWGCRLVRDGDELAVLHVDRIDALNPADGRDRQAAGARVTVRLEARDRGLLSIRLLVRILDGWDHLERTASRDEPTTKITGAGTPPEAVAAPRTRLSARTGARACVNVLLNQQLEKLIGNVSGARSGLAANPVHEIRVASQRMRTALRLFREHLPRGAKRLRAELGWLRRELGGVRDIDVQLEHVAVWRREGNASERSLDALQEKLAARRKEARGTLLEALESERFAALLEQVDTFCRSPDPTSGPGAEPIARFVPRLMRRRYADVKRRLARLGPRSAFGESHRARIRLRALRYLLEFVEDVYGKALKKPVEELKRLQDRLGAIQDSAVSIALLRRIAETDGGLSRPTVFELGRLAEACRHRAERLGSGPVRVLHGAPWKRLLTRAAAIRDALP